MTTRRRLATIAVLALCGTTALVGCGDDDDTSASDTTEAAADDGTTTTEAGADEPAGGDTAEVCTAYTEVTLAFGGEPEGDPAAWFAENVEPHIVTLEEQGPEEIADALAVMTDAARKAGEGGDFSAFEAPEFAEAQSEVDPYMYENCEFDTKLEVTGADYSFEGMPEEVDAGRVAVLFTNEGAEAHEIGVARKKDGVTESWDELLELPEDQVETKVDFVGGAFAAQNGDQGLLVGDFEPGDYIALCFVPVGTTVDESGEHAGDGPPHFMEGMRQEFTVA